MPAPSVSLIDVVSGHCGVVPGGDELDDAAVAGVAGPLLGRLGLLRDSRKRRGVRFTLACIVTVAIAARLANRDSFTAIAEWAAGRPQWALKEPGCRQDRLTGLHVAPSERTFRRAARIVDHDQLDDLLCGWTAGLAGAGEVASPAAVQRARAGKAARARKKAREKARKAAKQARAARGRSRRQARDAAREARRARAKALRAAAAAVAGGRAKLPAGSAFGLVTVPAGHPVLPAQVYGDPRHVPALRGLGIDGKASRGAKAAGQEAPQHLAAFWHDTRLAAAQRAVDKKTNETKVIGPLIAGMDLDGACVTADALHSLAALSDDVQSKDGHVIFVIKGSQPRTYAALNALDWENTPVAAATFEAGRGRIETRAIQVLPAPPGLKYAGMSQAMLLERYTTEKGKLRAETVLLLTTATSDQASPADLLALVRGHWRATEVSHWIRDTDLREDDSKARAAGEPRFMATLGNTVLNLLRIHGVTNIAAERRRLAESNRKTLKIMGITRP